MYCVKGEKVDVEPLRRGRKGGEEGTLREAENGGAAALSLESALVRLLLLLGMMSSPSEKASDFSTIPAASSKREINLP